VAELVDAVVSNTTGGNTLPVRVRPRVPEALQPVGLQGFFYLSGQPVSNHWLESTRTPIMQCLLPPHCIALQKLFCFELFSSAL
jgi:hypothetical protein